MSLLQLSGAVAERYPGLHAGAWWAQNVDTSVHELPALATVVAEHPEAELTAKHMSAFFHATGAKGRSPVEFQIRKIAEGSMDYSRRNGLVDFLLYAEALTGLIVALHDGARVTPPLVLGLGRDADEPRYVHISGSERSVGHDEPVLISGGAIVASLVKGPDEYTKVVGTTQTACGVVFGAPDDPVVATAAALAFICEEGERRGVWKIAGRELTDAPSGVA